MNKRIPPRRPQTGRPYYPYPGHRYHRYHYYPWWYWHYDYDYDWGDYYDDFDLQDYYYLDQLESSRDEFNRGFKAGMKHAQKEIAQKEQSDELPTAGYCGSMGA